MQPESPPKPPEQADKKDGSPQEPEVKEEPIHPPPSETLEIEIVDVSLEYSAGRQWISGQVLPNALGIAPRYARARVYDAAAVKSVAMKFASAVPKGLVLVLNSIHEVVDLRLPTGEKNANSYRA